MQDFKKMDSKELAEWNDQMVKKHHKDGTLFESKNLILKTLERIRLKKIIKVGKLNPNDSILDLGCGEGFFISLLPNVKKITGIDISKLALKRAKEITSSKNNVELKWGDAHKLNIEDKYFDKVFSSEMLEHIPHPRKAIKEIHRVLKNNGIAVISVPDEKRIKLIMKIAKIFLLTKLLGSKRKQEKYDWHLHEADKNFIYNISSGLFNVKKIYRTPPVIGYRFIAVLKKQNEKK